MNKNNTLLYQAVLQADMIIGLLGNPDGLLQSQLGLLAEGKDKAFFILLVLKTLRLLRLLNLLVAKAAVQARQVESSVAEASTVAFFSVALPLRTGQDEAVKIMQEAVG